MSKETNHTTLNEVRGQFEEMRATLEQRLGDLRLEMADAQRESIAATAAGDKKMIAVSRAHLETLTGSLSAVESEIAALTTRQAEAEIAWAEQRQGEIEATIPVLEEEVRKAGEATRAMETEARRAAIAAMGALQGAEARLRDAKNEADHCGRTIANARVALSRLAPAPSVAGVPLALLDAVFIAKENVMIYGRVVAVGEEIRLPGPEAVNISVAASKAAPGRPMQRDDVVVVGPAPVERLQFVRWERATPKEETAFKEMPIAGYRDLRKTDPPPAPPRKVRVVSPVMLPDGNGSVRIHDVGEVVTLSVKDAADLAGSPHLVPA